MTVQFFVRHLPKSIITSNRTSKSDAGAQGKWAERAELQAETSLTIQATFQQDIPALDYVTVGITYQRTKKHPRDGRYRPDDPGNVGGDIQKAVLDSLVDMGVIPDDSYKHIAWTGQSIQIVDTEADEGILVTLEELVRSE